MLTDLCGPHCVIKDGFEGHCEDCHHWRERTRGWATPAQGVPVHGNSAEAKFERHLRRRP